jgi:hypothetical protein
MLCPLCEKRKPKRFCPGIGNNICPQCCGTYREVTIDCPSTCPYLRESRKQQRPASEMQPVYPEVDIGRSFIDERERLVMGLAFTISDFAYRERSLTDPDVQDVLDKFIRTLSTLRSGVIYESLPTGAVREGLFRALQQFVTEYRKTEERERELNRIRDVDVHKSAVYLARLAQVYSNGRPRSRAFIDLLKAQFPSQQKEQERASALILP